MTFHNLPPGDKLRVIVIAVGKNGMESIPTTVPIYTSKCFKSDQREAVCIPVCNMPARFSASNHKIIE